MSQDGMRHGDQVRRRGMTTPVQKRAGLGGHDQGDRGPRAGSPLHHPLQVLSAACLLPAGFRGPDPVPRRRRDPPPPRCEPVAASREADRYPGPSAWRSCSPSSDARDFQFFGTARIADVNLEQEAIELRFRQRVGSFGFHGVLRGQHEERVRQVDRSCRKPSIGAPAWLRAGRFASSGGVRLISSARITLPNSGPCTNRNTRLPVVWSSSRISVPVMSPGIRSGVN